MTTDESRNDITNGGGKVATVLVGTGVKPGYVGTVIVRPSQPVGAEHDRAGSYTIPNGAGLANQMTEFFQ